MKTVVTSIFTSIVVIAIYALASFLFAEPDYVTEKRFEEAHKEVVARIDSVAADVDSVLVVVGLLDTKVTDIQTDVKSLVHSQDSLKIGQRIIYNEVRKKGSKSFFEQFKNAW